MNPATLWRTWEAGLFVFVFALLLFYRSGLGKPILPLVEKSIQS